MLKNSVCLVFTLAVALQINAQALKLEAIIDSISKSHPFVKMYNNDIRAMDEAAKGARSWMAPDFNMGFWMTPYNSSLWKKSEMNPVGMGQYMIGGQQMIPNKKKLDADEAYMKAMSSTAQERKNAGLNELISDAKQSYYEWLVIEKKLSIIIQNEKVLNFMIENAELRYKSGLDKIDAYYKAKAALGNVKNMQLMYKNDIREKQIRLNVLMAINPSTQFRIDTTFEIKDFTTTVFDTVLFYQNRSDLKAIDKDIRLSWLKQESEKQNLKPQFGIRYDHMFGFGGGPMQFTLMGMMKLPIASWSAKMYKANIESLKWKSEALKSQKEMMMIEYRGMAYNMRNEMELKKAQMKLYETEIIPALKNNFKTMQLGYEQNTGELFELYDAWEVLNMTQLDYLELLNQVLKLQVTIERLIEKR